jgi:uncharacterized protein (DUF1499 family)
MRAIKRIAAIIAAVVIGLWIAVQFMGQTPPPGLGVTNGELAACPQTPNCICSDCEGRRKMPPLKFSGDPAEALAHLKSALSKLGIPVVEEQTNYIHAVATTPLMRFKDDLEFLISAEDHLIHFRSASRLGKSDLGKNRSRMNQIIAALRPSGIAPQTNN